MAQSYRNHTHDAGLDKLFYVLKRIQTNVSRHWQHQRTTERPHKQVFYHHTQGISQFDLSRDLLVGKATIERWYHKHYLLAHNEISVPNCPTILGIDEHFFSKRQGYATTFCNLKKNKIFDIVKGRSATSLAVNG